MDTNNKPHNSPPFSEALKTVPDVLGIRLNEQAKYQVLRKDGDIEIRHYEASMLAQISLGGTRAEAISAGFTRLADYIFGDNTTDLHDEEKHSEKMAMTAPVYHENKGGEWLISFVVPSKYNVTSVPRPLDSNIMLIEKPEKIVAALTYSGNNDDEKMMAALVELQEWIKQNGIKATSDFYFGQYDPPFTIPFLKRNEVLVKIEKDSH